MKPLRILYHHRTQGRGAEGNHIVSIVAALRALGHHVDVLSPPGVDPFDPQATMPVDKARTQTRGWASIWKLFSRYLPNFAFELAEIAYNVPAYFRVRRALRRGSYELLFERYAFFMVAGALAARLHGRAFVLEVNEVSGIPQRARGQSLPRLCAKLERYLLRNCVLVHAVSSYLGERLIGSGLPRARLIVAPNGFDVSRLRLTQDRDSVRSGLGLENTIVLGFAGWFDQWDRLDFLIEVFAEAHSRRPDVRLCLVGAGPAAEGLHRRIRALQLSEAVVMTGAVPRDKVYDYVQAFDIGILPHSNVFGSPIVMFEMMALRIPLVLPRLPPIEDVHADGDTALLFPPLDAERCRTAVGVLANSPELRVELADRAFRQLTRQHTWRCTAEKIVDAFDRVTKS